MTKKGRRPINFRVCRTARYSVAVEFWTASLSIGIFNFWGECVQSVTKELTPNMDADDVTLLITDIIIGLVQKFRISHKHIIGIGVAAPGQVDLSNNLIAYSRIKGMNGYPIVEKLKEKFHIPVILHNNCSALSVGEFRYGNFKKTDSLFTFLLRSGINGSFINCNTVYINSKQKTIEAGHIPVQIDGPECSCGKKGCLEACLKSIDPNSDHLMLFSTIDTSSSECSQLMDRAAKYLNVAVNIISQLFAPSAYLIVACNDRIASMLAERLQKLQQIDYFEKDIPDFYHAIYDPLFTLRGINDQVIERYFFEEII